jgi:RNA polymerase sigma-70 factor, ECF subfamily
MTLAIETETASTDTDPLAGLVARIARGDQRAFAQLYDATAARVYARSYAVLRNHSLTCEAVQETYLDVWKHIAEFDGRLGAVAPWITTIARRRAIDCVRHQEATERRDAIYAHTHYTRPYDATYESAIRHLDVDRLHENLAGLSPFQRQLIILVYFAELSLAEVATSLGIPLGTAKTRLRDGLNKLRATVAIAP